MPRNTFTTEQQDAFRSLLDDKSPTTRRALLRYFSDQHEAAQPFLKAIANGSNRILAWAARAYLDELKFSDPVADFKAFIRSFNYELETGSLLLARTVHPDADAGAVCSQLDALAARCHELTAEPASPREHCRVLNRILFHEYGLQGNISHYTDPLNSLLPEVLARRKGIPISLSIVYLLVAHRIGLELEPVGLPGHFVVGCYLEDEPFFVDPFERGAFRSADELRAFLRANKIEPSPADLAPCPIREVLCRCCRNLAHHYGAAGDEPRARLFQDFVEEFDAAYARHTAP